MSCMFSYYFFDCCYSNIAIRNSTTFTHHWSFNFLKAEHTPAIRYSHDGRTTLCVGWYRSIPTDCRDSNRVDTVYVPVVRTAVAYHSTISRWENIYWSFSLATLHYKTFDKWIVISQTILNYSCYDFTIAAKVVSNSVDHNRVLRRVIYELSQCRSSPTRRGGHGVEPYLHLGRTRDLSWSRPIFICIYLYQ